MKPCPFCGRSKTKIQEVSTERGDGFVVECENCNANGPLMSDEQTAITAWDKDARVLGTKVPEIDKVPFGGGGSGGGGGRILGW